MYLSDQKIKVLGRVIEFLSQDQSTSDQEVRHHLGELMMTLLDAQHFASFVWNEQRQCFDSAIQINMSPDNIQRYEAYYQFNDPITQALQAHRQAVRVTDVMAQTALKKTEFFNDFLNRDGLHWGINLYAWMGQQNIGDLRIWRDKNHGNFSLDDVKLLDMVRPAFTASLARKNSATQAASTSISTCSIDALSPREQAIAHLITRGYSDKEIARHLGIAPSTVRTHINKAFQKLDVNKRMTFIQRFAQLRQAPKT